MMATQAINADSQKQEVSVAGANGKLAQQINNNNICASFEISLDESPLNGCKHASRDNLEARNEQKHDDDQFIKCSAIHTLERNMPDFDYSHLVKELRERILAYCESGEGLFSQKDYDKCKNDDWHLSRFLLRQNLDVDAAFNMLKKAMRFKHENLCNFIRSEDFPTEFYQVGGLFCYEPDRKGNLMLYIRGQVHRKIPEIAVVFHAFLMQNIEQADEAAKGRGISLVLDCTGAGLVNADMDILFLLISTLLNYFPKGLSYILVHNLPWILKPFWHIAKAWIPEEHRELVKFSDARTIYEYVERENLPDFMGGTCKRDYRQPPDNCTTLEEAAKLWGIDRSVVKRVLLKFTQYLPPESLERFMANEEKEDCDTPMEQDQENNPHSID